MIPSVLIRFLCVIALGCMTFIACDALAHNVSREDAEMLAGRSGMQLLLYMWLGAKHMVTGYDHLLFLVGVIFFLYRTRDVLIYVSFFTIGHSLTLLFGVYNDIQVNAFLIDAVIGLSIVYKGFDNLGGFKRLTGYQPDTRAAVLVFGLFHGFGLATKLQEFEFGGDGLLQNLLAFNVGVEIGQFIALSFVLIALSFWRNYDSYLKFSTASNTLLMSGGVILTMYQLTGFLISPGA
jgi:hypothetical protein